MNWNDIKILFEIELTGGSYNFLKKKGYRAFLGNPRNPLNYQLYESKSKESNPENTVIMPLVGNKVNIGDWDPFGVLGTELLKNIGELENPAFLVCVIFSPKFDISNFEKDIIEDDYSQIHEFSFYTSSSLDAIQQINEVASCKYFRDQRDRRIILIQESQNYKIIYLKLYFLDRTLLLKQKKEELQDLETDLIFTPNPYSGFGGMILWIGTTLSIMGIIFNTPDDMPSAILGTLEWFWQSTAKSRGFNNQPEASQFQLTISLFSIAFCTFSGIYYLANRKKNEAYNNLIAKIEVLEKEIQELEQEQ